MGNEARQNKMYVLIHEKWICLFGEATWGTTEDIGSHKDKNFVLEDTMSFSEGVESG